MIPLEDNYADILAKAQRGLKLSDEAVASSAGLALDEWKNLKDGVLHESSLYRAASVLQLHAPSLAAVALGRSVPNPVSIENFAAFNTPYKDMTVNSYLIWNPETKEAIAFDTGADADPLLFALQKEGLTLKLLLLTHGHGDHILELDRILERTGAEAWISSAEAVEGARTFHPGHSFQCGGIMIFTRLTCGHSPGGITYVISPFNRQLAVVGDALFARSMGGGLVSYSDALRSNREEIFTLLDDTILAPGHGPLTTVAEEKKFNPFYPEFK